MNSMRPTEMLLAVLQAGSVFSLRVRVRYDTTERQPRTYANLSRLSINQHQPASNLQVFNGSDDTGMR